MTESFMRATGMDIFEQRIPHETGYRVVVPGVALSGRDLPVRLKDNVWTVGQRAGGHNYEGRGDSILSAIFDIVLQRTGDKEHACVPGCKWYSVSRETTTIGD